MDESKDGESTKVEENKEIEKEKKIQNENESEKKIIQKEKHFEDNKDTNNNNEDNNDDIAAVIVTEATDDDSDGLQLETVHKAATRIISAEESLEHPVTWAPDVDYEVGAVVSVGDKQWRATVEHVSSSTVSGDRLTLADHPGPRRRKRRRRRVLECRLRRLDQRRRPVGRRQ